MAGLGGITERDSPMSETVIRYSDGKMLGAALDGGRGVVDGGQADP